MKLTDKQREMVEENVKLAYYMANKYMKSNYELVARKGLTFEDLNQVALEQLCTSVKTYNPDISKFSTYAGTGMYLKINKFVRMYNSIKIPRHDHWYKYESNIDELVTIGNGYMPSLDQAIAKDNDGRDLYYGDMTGEDEFGFEQIELNDLLQKTLNNREVIALGLHLNGKTQSEIGNLLGFSQKHISITISKAKEKLERELIA